MYKKVVKFSFKPQKIFWVLVFSFMYLVLVDAMDRSEIGLGVCTLNSQFTFSGTVARLVEKRKIVS